MRPITKTLRAGTIGIIALMASVPFVTQADVVPERNRNEHRDRNEAAASTTTPVQDAPDASPAATAPTTTAATSTNTNAPTLREPQDPPEDTSSSTPVSSVGNTPQDPTPAPRVDPVDPAPTPTPPVSSPAPSRPAAPPAAPPVTPQTQTPTASADGTSNQFSPLNYYTPLDNLSPGTTYGLSALAMICGIAGAFLIIREPRRGVMWTPNLGQQSLLEP